MKGGLLLLFKAPGPTSHDLVERARRLFPGQKVGHGGTLDPAAAGLLVLLVGSATRLSRYLLEADKAYLFEVAFGVETDTGDQEGEAARSSAPPSAERVREVLPAFHGAISQRIPSYSAVKRKGRPRYQWARQGKELPLEERRVTVHRLEMVRFSQEEAAATFYLEASHGTYVRQLAVDLARAAGSAGHVSALLRSRVGSFTLEEAYPWEDVVTLAGEGRLPLLQPERLLPSGWPHLALSPPEKRELRQGAWPRSLKGISEAALFSEGELVAVVETGGKGRRLLWLGGEEG
ncbi:MAG: tRNA pseudouridine(55) synthase TruB [Bacillota bacterium]|nr:tRNA pseudouridine(55) synthase TruB [Bacillota bacterium]